MNTNHFSTATSIVLILTVTLVCAPLRTDAQEPGQDYYVVDGQKVYLTGSDEYRALSIKADTRGAFNAAVERGNVATIQSSPVLDKYDIVLLKQNTTVTRSAFHSGVQNLAGSAPVEAEFPVYRMGNVDQVLPNEFIVQFSSDAGEEDINAFLDANGADVVQKSARITNRYTVTLPGRSSREALSIVNAFNDNELVKFAEPNFIRIFPLRPKVMPRAEGDTSAVPPASPAPEASTTPSPSVTIANDPLFSNQWGLSNAGSPGVADSDIDAPEAWDVTTGSPQVIIAILDEGVDVLHPDLRNKIVTPYDATDGDDDQQPNDWDGHGTACAGIAAAIGNNQEGIAGVSWTAKILPVRIAYSMGPGQGWITDDATIEDGIRTAVDRGAHVLSNSWGGGSPSNAINSAVDYALNNNRTVVFAAGNDSGPVFYPATLSSTRAIITVSATNEWDEFKTKTSQDGEYWWGSNFGPEVNISAPGVHIVTTDIEGNAGYANGDYVANFNGTSSAAPFVAGGAALLLAGQPGATPTQVRDWLQDSANDLGPNGFDDQFGHGRLNVDKAVDLAFGQPPLKVKLAIDNPGVRLRNGDVTTARATVTRAGSPQSGVSVTFTTADPNLATILLPRTVPTNGQGVAEAQVRGETSGLPKTTQVKATANGDSATKPVKVPNLPIWAIAFLSALFIMVLARRLFV